MRQVNLFDLYEWDSLVTKTYGKPYTFQQQDGCKNRGTYHFTVPDYKNEQDDEMNENISDSRDVAEMGVKFATWLLRNPETPLQDQEYDWELSNWWDRHFYPDTQTLANDMFKRGVLPAGDYVIDIDW